MKKLHIMLISINFFRVQVIDYCYHAYAQRHRKVWKIIYIFKVEFYRKV